VICHLVWPTTFGLINIWILAQKLKMAAETFSSLKDYKNENQNKKVPNML
jgi:hypothetical protein